MLEKECIGREAVIEKLNEIGGCDATDEWSKGWDKAIDTAVKAVEKLPSADVAPVKHGYWIKTGGYACGDYEFKCASCGKTYWESNGYATRSHFCPNCGADMSNT